MCFQYIIVGRIFCPTPLHFCTFLNFRFKYEDAVKLTPNSRKITLLFCGGYGELLISVYYGYDAGKTYIEVFPAILLMF